MLDARSEVRRLARRAVRATRLARIPGVRLVHEWYLARTEHVKECTYGAYTLAYPSRSVIGQAVASGTGWDTVLVPLIEGLVVRDDPLIIDVGANVGASLMQIKIAKPRSRVYCCEPSVRFRPLLAQNIEANHWSDVTIVPALIGSSVEEKTLYVNTSTASSVAVDYGSHGRVDVETVVATTLDQLLAHEENVSFLKSDTDGSEYDVLRGAQDLLTRSRPALFFEFAPWLLRASGHEPEALLEFLANVGYRRFLMLSPAGQPLQVSDDLGWIAQAADEAKYVDLVCTHCADQDASRRLALFLEGRPTT